MQTSQVEDMRDVISMYQIAQHSNVVRLEDYFENREFFYLCLELHSEQTLYRYALQMSGLIPEQKIQMMAKQLGSALEYLHDIGIVLRSFDASGILMTEGTKDQNNETLIVLARISNLKGACLLGDMEETIGLYGDIRFRAPEVIQGKHYNAKADSWSFGVILFLLMIGKLPFDPETYEESHGSKCTESVEYLILHTEAPTDLILKYGYTQ